MSKLTLEEKAKWVREQCLNLNMTAYEIGNATNLNISGIQKFLRDESVTPRNNTLNTIIDYIEEKAPGANIPEHINYRPGLTFKKTTINEPNPEYSGLTPAEQIELQKKQIKLLEEEIEKWKAIAKNIKDK